ncbi:MAG: hypothetical protein HY775_12570 [Acidobacteria bacterium]|nr:hypothetical protein [Acidobacteriota bacterium]
MRMSSFVRALAGVLLAALLGAGPALAAASPEPAKGGHPWYFWLGVVALVLAGLQALQICVSWVIQSRGFDRPPPRPGGTSGAGG